MMHYPLFSFIPMLLKLAARQLLDGMGQPHRHVAAGCNDYHRVVI